MTRAKGYPYLPPGYLLDKYDPDILVLRREDGTAIAHFSAQGTTREAIEEAVHLSFFCSLVILPETHNYTHHYRGYWSDGGKCRIRIYQEDRRASVVAA